MQMAQTTRKTTKKTTASTANAVTSVELGLLERYDIDPVEFATWVRALRQNWRQGTVACKGRSDVAFANRKPFKQKGTGRARAGSARSPVWRGGGVVFGPMARTRKLDVSAELRKRVMNSLLWQFIDQQRFVSIPFQVEKPSTAAAFDALKAAGLTNSKVMVLVEGDDLVTQASFANIPSVDLALHDQLNAYDVANVDYLVVCSKDVENCKQALQRWN